MSDVVRDFNTEELIEYLGRKDLKLKESHFKILHKEEITGRSFLKLTKEKLERFVFEEISDDDKTFKYCMKDIILKLSNVETITDANEKDISSEDVTGRVDYAIKSLKDLLCITEGKPRNIKIGYVQAQSGILSYILLMVYTLRAVVNIRSIS
ncbi:hypothetical protein C1646_776422 [Rhizophagus diaphanus]|nr:hypothetical protein C1646_776422 [Rhizophagus diaphanus] [Rhizophagus sp. MUCL 43196]